LSRLRSARGASGPKASSRAGGGRPGVFVQAPRSDIYVTMLGVALGAMLLGCLLLLLILNRYEFKTTVSAAPNTAPVALATFSENFGTVRL
jgi:hypothetical protein